MFIAIAIVVVIFLIPAFLLYRYWKNGGESDPGGSWGDQIMGDEDQPLK
jgi:hypothetical protein